MSATIRPLYSRNMGVPAESSTTLARCGSLWVTRPFSTVLTSVGTSAFHCERRACVRERDFFLLGTAMTISLSPYLGKPRIPRTRPNPRGTHQRGKGKRRHDRISDESFTIHVIIVNLTLDCFP